MLDVFDAKTIRPKKDKPDAWVLERLHEACEMYDMDGVDAALSEICAYEYDADGGLSVWLREMADATDFAAIAKRLTEKA